MKYYGKNEQEVVQQIENHLSKYGKDRTYFDIAELYNFRPYKTRQKRLDDVRSIARRMRNEGIPFGNGEPIQKWGETGFVYNDEEILSRKISKEIWEDLEGKLVFGEDWNEFLKWKYDQTLKVDSTEIRLRNLPKPYKGNPDNIIVIGDLHEPFCLEGYLEECRKVQERFDCGRVIFIGDCIDSYWESFYDKDIDAPLTQQQERQQALTKLKEWYTVFPEATVTVGNHTLRYYRKGNKFGIHPDHFRPLDEILKAPKTWNFVNEIIIDNVLYRHGATGHAFTNAQKERMSVVEGDKHTLGYVQWSSSRKDNIFGMQVGCGVDIKKFAFNYAKNTSKKPVIGCGVVLDRGQTPLFIKMNNL